MSLDLGAIRTTLEVGACSLDAELDALTSVTRDSAADRIRQARRGRNERGGRPDRARRAGRRARREALERATRARETRRRHLRRLRPVRGLDPRRTAGGRPSSVLCITAALNRPDRQRPSARDSSRLTSLVLLRSVGALVGRFLYRVGRFGAEHRLLVAFIWLAAVAATVGAVRVLGAKTNNELTLPGTDSQAAFDILAERFPPQQNGTSPFVFAVDDGKLTDQPYKEAIGRTFHKMQRAEHVYSVLNPVSKDGRTAGILSDDGSIGFMPVLLDVDSGFITEELAHKVLDATAPARAAGIDVAVGGPIGSELSQPDTSTSERLGNLAAMVILALVFGSLVAMGLPILNAAIGLAIATSVIGLLGHLISVPTVAPTLATMIGLGVGIDYALFLVTKHKEELASGVQTRESIARAVSSSGSAVFAGSTVMIALVSLAVAGIPLVWVSPRPSPCLRRSSRRSRSCRRSCRSSAEGFIGCAFRAFLQLKSDPRVRPDGMHGRVEWLDIRGSRSCSRP